MKIYLKRQHKPRGWEFHFERQPMEDAKFYALVGLAAAALFVALLVSSSIIKHLG